MLEVFVELPFAIAAFEVGGRKAGKKEPGLLQPLQDAVAPVLHALDFVCIEEGLERAAGEGLEVAADAPDELGDAAVFIVPPGVADKKIVAHFGIPKCG